MLKKDIHKLERGKKVTTKELIDRTKRARRNVAKKIRKASDNPKIATVKGVREHVYNEVNKTYVKLTAGMNEILLAGTLEAVEISHAGAIAERIATGAKAGELVTKFDPKRVERYWSILNPVNEASLSAVYTQNMAQADVRALRAAFMDTFRQAQLEGWTGNEIHKHLQQKWWHIAKRVDSQMFIDASGRAWNNSDYLRMLTRTTLQRTARESYMDTLVEMGDELAVIQTVGENCPICDSWDQVIISITGASKKHPSYREALSAGWGHPACDCMTEGIVAAIDQDEIDRQAEIQHPEPINEDESIREYSQKMQAYNDKFKISRKRAEGQTAEQADISLKRDKLKHNLQVANLSRFDDVVKSIPDDVLGKIKQDAIPRFGYTKKGDKSKKPAWNTKSSRGGVVHMDRDPDKEGGTSAAFKGQLQELFGKSGVEWK